MSETQRIILENRPIRKNYLPALSNLCRYGLQSPRSPGRALQDIRCARSSVG